jgi:uncharacterized protein YegP (UPF0339 family)
VDSDASATDWQRIKALTDREIDAAIADDADSYAVSAMGLGHQKGRYTYNLYRDKDGAWHWQVVAQDGRILAAAAGGLATRELAQAAIAELRSTLLGTPKAA